MVKPVLRLQNEQGVDETATSLVVFSSSSGDEMVGWVREYLNKGEMNHADWSQEIVKGLRFFIFYL